MFVEVNSLKGIIANIGRANELLSKAWCDILDLIPCVFITYSDEQEKSLCAAIGRNIKCVRYRSSWSGLKKVISECLAVLGYDFFETAYVTPYIEDFKDFPVSCGRVLVVPGCTVKE